MKDEGFLKRTNKIKKIFPKCSRRNFIKTIGIAGAGSICNPFSSLAETTNLKAAMPTRPFGKTGINVPILGFGTSLDVSLGSLLLKQAVKLGATYWDTATSYMGGRSEKGIGKYFEKFPGDRKKIFLVTKSNAWTLYGMTQDLEKSLERMKTDYIDLFFAHGIKRKGSLDDDLKEWAEKTKKEGKIRFFGFSTHNNMEECLLKASSLNWIDGIMFSYNYRLMHDKNMEKAVDACAKAGIGLTAMKTQGGGQIGADTETELKMAEHFLKKGYTEFQAKLKAVWENPHISSICSEMPNTTILMSNTAAALDKTKLSARDRDELRQYASKTSSNYCAGCSSICESAVRNKAPVGDVMRYLMYCQSYKKRSRTVDGFKKIPEKIRIQLMELNYTEAEQKCPRKLSIGKLMRKAVHELG